MMGELVLNEVEGKEFFTIKIVCFRPYSPIFNDQSLFEILNFGYCYLFLPVYQGQGVNGFNKSNGDNDLVLRSFSISVVFSMASWSLGVASSKIWGVIRTISSDFPVP